MKWKEGGRGPRYRWLPHGYIILSVAQGAVVILILDFLDIIIGTFMECWSISCGNLANLVAFGGLAVSFDHWASFSFPLNCPPTIDHPANPSPQCNSHLLQTMQILDFTKKEAETLVKWKSTPRTKHPYSTGKICKQYGTTAVICKVVGIIMQLRKNSVLPK